MKKITILIIAITAALLTGALSGCEKTEAVVYDPNEGAFDAWVSADERIRAADSMEFNINETFVLFDNNDDGFEVSNVGVVKEVIRSEDDIDIELSFDINSGDKTNKVTGFYKDGYMYYNFQGSKSKRATDTNSAEREVYADMLDLSSLTLKSSSVSEVKGGRALRFVLDGDADVFKFTTDSIIQAFSLNNKESVAPTTIKIPDGVIYIVEIDKDYAIKNITMAFTGDISFMGGNLRTYYEIKKKVVKTSGVSVKFPADLSDYT